jgi:hypothetical protein
MYKRYYYGLSLVIIGVAIPIAFVMMNYINPMPDFGSALWKIIIATIIVTGYGLRTMVKYNRRKPKIIENINKELEGTGYILKPKP